MGMGRCPTVAFGREIGGSGVCFKGGTCGEVKTSQFCIDLLICWSLLSPSCSKNMSYGRIASNKSIFLYQNLQFLPRLLQFLFSCRAFLVSFHAFFVSFRALLGLFPRVFGLFSLESKLKTPDNDPFSREDGSKNQRPGSVLSRIIYDSFDLILRSRRNFKLTHDQMRVLLDTR